jgi:hypothetical protein
MGASGWLQTAMGQRPMAQGGTPRSEPEIIPPDHVGQDSPRMKVFIDTGGTRRVYVAKPGPLAAILVILMTVILSAVLLVLLSAAFLIAMPVAVLLVAAAIIAGLWRGFFQRAP